MAKRKSGEIPSVTSTLRWEDVTLPASITVEEVDRLLFAELRPQWRKTAMVVGTRFAISLL